MRRAGRLRVGQRFAVVIAILGVLLAAAIVTGAIGLTRVAGARTDLLDRITPARTSAQVLQNAYLNQETGLRGFVLTGRREFLAPYTQGRTDEREQLQALRRTLGDPSLRDLRRRLDAVTTAAARWQQGFAVPAIAGRRTANPRDDVVLTAGRARLDALRGAQARLRQDLARADVRARDRLDSSAADLGRLMAAFALALVTGGVVAVLFVRRAITLPLTALTAEVRRVADGDFDAEISASGPQDIVSLGDDVDAMRARIVAELVAIRSVQEDLERSNTELEQFAYVASHDLQEPLRKVASFTQMLQRRYSGQLDDRADQYIFFAVDGAKRMQELINDLLALSRVGRVTRVHGAVPLTEVIERALTDLAGAIDESGAVVHTRGAAPTVRVDAGLMALVVQNLVGNAIKFSAEGSTPEITLTVAERVGVGVGVGDGECEVAIRDNGIGIDGQYADRIFVIFQRLHPKEEYGGTGIGLAMCRKIVEYHGGRIWLDVDGGGPGTTFRFTLPLADPAPDTDPQDSEDTIA